MGRLNRLLTFGTPDRTWCCDRCRAAAFGGENAVGWKHVIHPNDAHTDLPELESNMSDETQGDGRQLPAAG